MKRSIQVIIGILALFCLGFVIRGNMKFSLFREIANSKMMLVSDTTNTNDFEAKLYEMAYSSPVASEEIDLWLEAVLTRNFETFSTNGHPIFPEFVNKLNKLSGWPLNRTVGIDLSHSEATDDAVVRLGKLPRTEWINLNGAKVTEKALLSILRNAPKLRRLQLQLTNVDWSDPLVDAVLKHPSIKIVEVDESRMMQGDLDKLKSGLSSR